MNKTSPNAAEWFEIPTADIAKSIPFYNQVLGLQMEAVEFGPNQIAILPHEKPSSGGCLMQGAGMVPSAFGSVVYLSVTDMDGTIARVEPAGGKVVVPKTPIGPNRGFFARFLDLEGNVVGLCSLA